MAYLKGGKHHEKSAALLAIVLGFAAQGTAACGKCEYKEKWTRVCLPKIGCSHEQLDPINPVEQAKKLITLATAVASGDMGQIKASLGNVLMNSSNCLTCPMIAHTVLPNLTDEQINSIVGEGALVFAATQDPVLVTLDVANNVAREQKIAKARSTPPIPVNEPKSRQAQEYFAQAKCLIFHDSDEMAYAAWTAPAIFRDNNNGEYQFPNVDLLPGDTINITAPLCPAWDNPNAGTYAITSVSLTFEAVSSLTGDEKTLKWIVAGKTTKTKTKR